jgi:hypothetical protein
MPAVGQDAGGAAARTHLAEGDPLRAHGHLVLDSRFSRA